MNCVAVLLLILLVQQCLSFSFSGGGAGLRRMLNLHSQQSSDQAVSSDPTLDLPSTVVFGPGTETLKLVTAKLIGRETDVSLFAGGGEDGMKVAKRWTKLM